MTGRTARIERTTSESSVLVDLDLDGTGQVEISTGVRFYDHMLTAFGVHGSFDLTVRSVGDVDIDAHHTVEDTAIVLGQAIGQALGDKAGIRRFGDAFIPMDETLAHAAVDVSGRPFSVHTGEPDSMLGFTVGGNYPVVLNRHVFDSLGLSRPDRAARAGDLRPRPAPHLRGAVQGHRPGAAGGGRAGPAGARASRRPRACCERRYRAESLSDRDDRRVPDRLRCCRRRRCLVGESRVPARRRVLAASSPPAASSAVWCGCCDRLGSLRERGEQRVVVLDYGSGNLASAERALRRTGADVEVTADFDAALACDGLVVPGVGAYAACMAGLHAVRGRADHRPAAGRWPPGARDLRRDADPVRRGVEHGVQTDGVGRVAGHRRTAAGADRAAHGLEHRRSRSGVGAVRRTRPATPGSTSCTPTPCGAGSCRSAGRCRPPVVTWAEHGGDRFVAAVENGPLSATQFHPEKSGDAGAEVLGRWVAAL